MEGPTLGESAPGIAYLIIIITYISGIGLTLGGICLIGKFRSRKKMIDGLKALGCIGLGLFATCGLTYGLIVG